MEDWIFFICYPGGDKSKITVGYESYSCSYEIEDYSLASRERWCESSEAIVYCKELAKKHGLEYVPCSFDGDKNEYLD